MPLSSTQIRTMPPDFSSDLNRTCGASAATNFTALPIRFTRTCRKVASCARTEGHGGMTSMPAADLPNLCFAARHRGLHVRLQDHRDQLDFLLTQMTKGQQIEE